MLLSINKTFSAIFAKTFASLQEKIRENQRHQRSISANFAKTFAPLREKTRENQPNPRHPRSIKAVIIFAIALTTSCSSPTSIQEAKTQIENPSNGLTQTITQNGFSYTISLWPANYVMALKKEQTNNTPLTYFQLNTNKPDFMFRASEQNFSLKVGEQTYPASIAIAENLGSAQTNRVMIGFPSEYFAQDCKLIIQDYNQKILATALFTAANYKKIEKLNIQENE